MSVKAQKCFAQVKKLQSKGDRIEWYCPHLPPSPQKAMEMVMSHISSWQGYQMAVIGSSLGGYYANYIAEHKRCGAVLLNPAIEPALALKKAIDQQDASSAEDAQYLKPDFIDELKSLEVPVTMPERYFLIVAKGDELLDYRQALERYRKSATLVLDQSNHQLTDFDDYIDEVFEFIGLGE